MIDKLKNSPLLVRVIPFVLYLALTYFQGAFGEASKYWFYVAKTFVGAGVLMVVWSSISELKVNFSWEAVVVGVGVCVMWVGLDGFYPGQTVLMSDHIGPFLKNIGLGSIAPEPSSEPDLPWNPLAQFGAGLGWFVIVVRILGSSLLVPALEEVFYRSFLYRYIANPDFQTVKLGAFKWVPFIVTAIFFGFAHQEWLAGILCAFAYQGLVCWKGRLGDAVVAHGITNFLLGVWIVTQDAWQFW